MTERPKLLMATHVVPVPENMACKVRMMMILKHLAEKLDVTLVSLCADGAPAGGGDPLRRLCTRFVPVPAPNKRSPAHKAYHRARTEFLSLCSGVPEAYFYTNVPAMDRALHDTLRAGGPFDALLVEYWYTSDALSRIQGPLKIVDTHDVDALKNEEMRRNLPGRYARYSRWMKQRNNARRERAVLARYDLLAALTEADRTVFRDWLGEEKEILCVPSGVDTGHFRPQGARTPSRPPRVTFFGAMQSEGNVRAALYFHDEVFPRVLRERPDARFVILGAHPPPSIQALGRRPNVEVTGYVPDVRPPLLESTVVVCPFQMGYGFRGRVLEPMALEVPVVSTSIAVMGVGLREGWGILLRDTPESFAEAVLQLMRNPSQAEECGKRGRQVVEERFSLASTYGRFTETVLQRIQARREETRGRCRS